jgi:hypothetical protein
MATTTNTKSHTYPGAYLAWEIWSKVAGLYHIAAVVIVNAKEPVRGTCAATHAATNAVSGDYKLNGATSKSKTEHQNSIAQSRQSHKELG